MSPLQGWFPIEHTTAFAVSGADSVRYLNGQLSIDITRLREGHARHACLLTAKGKLCGLPLVWRAGDTIVLECPSALADDLHARLERYLIADEVVVKPLTLPPRFHLIGSPPPPDAICSHRLGIAGYDTTTRPSTPSFDPTELEPIRILHGMPAWDIDITTDTLPQEARLDLFAVDFDKGCYVGQETVSRLRSVGRVNKRLHLLTGEITPGCTAPLTLHLADGSPAGHLTSHTPLPANNPHFPIAQSAALGYLHRMHEDADTLTVRNADGHECGHLHRQSYPLP